MLLAASLLACQGRGNKKEQYQTQKVDRGDITMTVTATGTLSAVTTVQVGSQVSGVISRLFADFNSHVKKGQLLAQLDPTPFQAQVEQRQADVDQSDIGRVQVGQLSRFTVDSYPDQEFRGQISQIRLNATVSQNVVTYPVIITVPNPEEKLRPKMTANVTIEVATVHDVLRIANAALRFKPDNATTGGALWHARLGSSVSNGPITYELDGTQYVIVGAVDTVYAFAKPR